MYKLFSFFLILICARWTCYTCLAHDYSLVTSHPTFSSIQQFQGIFFADDKGIVLDTKLLHINGTKAATNASILMLPESYLLSFKDNLSLTKRGYATQVGLRFHRKPYTHVKIGLVELDRNFEQKGDTIFIDSRQIAPEDPRLFYFDENLYVIHFVKSSFDDNWRGYLMLSLIDPNGWYYNPISLQYKSKQKRVEKNWVPFEHRDKNGIPSLYFVYTFNPLEIIQFTKSGDMKQAFRLSSSKFIAKHWEERWGQIRGGTPALLIGDEYLTFFHSSFTRSLKKWYVFGALALENKPPFRIKKISKNPIIFRDCFTAPMLHYEWYGLSQYYVIFPSGFVVGHKDGNEVFHVACGENDCAIRLVTIDKKALLKDMLEVKE